MPGSMPTTATMLIIFSKYTLKKSKLSKNQKKTSTGVKCADNVYRSTFKKRLENER